MSNFLTINKENFKISFAPLQIEEVYSLVDTSANGAIVIMSGTVRDQTAGKTVTYLEYQAYQPMALEVFSQIAKEVQQRWIEVNTLAIHHRIGRLAIGEISVLVAVGSPHRADAFAACSYIIDNLKHNAPIWKKEFWLDGSSDWISIAQCDHLV